MVDPFDAASQKEKDWAIEKVGLPSIHRYNFFVAQAIENLLHREGEIFARLAQAEAMFLSHD